MEGFPQSRFSLSTYIYSCVKLTKKTYRCGRREPDKALRWGQLGEDNSKYKCVEIKLDLIGFKKNSHTINDIGWYFGEVDIHQDIWVSIIKNWAWTHSHSRKNITYWETVHFQRKDSDYRGEKGWNSTVRCTRGLSFIFHGGLCEWFVYHGLSAHAPDTWCYGHCSIAMKRHHDQGNFYERKYLIGSSFTVSEVWYFNSMVGRMVASSQV